MKNANAVRAVVLIAAALYFGDRLLVLEDTDVAENLKYLFGITFFTDIVGEEFITGRQKAYVFFDFALTYALLAAVILVLRPARPTYDQAQGPTPMYRAPMGPSGPSGPSGPPMGPSGPPAQTPIPPGIME